MKPYLCIGQLLSLLWISVKTVCKKERMDFWRWHLFNPKYFWERHSVLFRLTCFKFIRIREQEKKWGIMLYLSLMLKRELPNRNIRIKAAKVSFKPHYNFLSSLFQHKTGTFLFASSISSWHWLKPLKQYFPLAEWITGFIASIITAARYQADDFCQATAGADDSSLGQPGQGWAGRACPAPPYRSRQQGCPRPQHVAPHWVWGQVNSSAQPGCSWATGSLGEAR